MLVATIGTGFIVDTFLSALNDVEGATCVAIYSRMESTAKPLAEKYNVSKVYTKLEDMLADEAIDFIYVASPNSLHYEHARLALSANKHVICEKPFASNSNELRHLITLAKEKKLFLFEAITTIHLPNFKLAKENINRLGEIKSIQCNYSQYSSRYAQLLAGEMTNVFNPTFSGGALVDINIYNLHFVMRLFGEPVSTSYTANLHENGIDTSGILVLQYDGFIASCLGSKDTNGVNFALIQGEKGYMHVEHGANGCRNILMHEADLITEINMQENDNLLYYELVAFQEMYYKKDLDQCYELLAYSDSVLKIVDKAREDAGIVFSADRQ